MTVPSNRTINATIFWVAGLIFILSCNIGKPSSQQPARASVTAASANNQPNPPPAGDVVSPDDFAYLGAFRLPGGEDHPQTFAYGGNAMTFDQRNSLLYVLELYADGAKPVVHVWRINSQ